MPRKRACDRCHDSKKKCIDNRGLQKCEGCTQASSACTTNRNQSRQGRRPREGRFGDNSAVHVWDAEYQNRPSSHLPSWSESTASDQMTVHNTSDHDTFTSGLVIEPPASNHTKSFHGFKHQKEQLFDPDSPDVIKRFSSHFDIFMLGPSFATDFRTAVKCLYTCSPNLLHDIIQELEFAMPPSHQTSLKIVKAVDITTGSSSIETLRMVQATSFDNAFAIIGLGQILAAFDLFTCCTGAESILKSSLLCVNSWCEDLGDNHLSRSVLVGSILWDTVCSLARQEVPVTTIPSSAYPAVDRMAGLCTTLLPILYDLCVASERLRNPKAWYTTDSMMIDVEHVRQRLLKWAPIRTDGFSSDFSYEEVVRMEAQASMYKNAGLLICHRIIHPVGTLDEPASSFATTIVHDFEKSLSTLDVESTLNFVHFPLLLAALEIENMSRDVWKSVALAASAPVWVSKVQDLIDYVWSERRGGTTMSLLELVRNGPDFIVIP